MANSVGIKIGDTESYIAAADLSSNKFRFVKQASDLTINVCTAVTDKPVGVQQTGALATSGLAVSVKTAGQTQMEAAAAIAFGAYVGPSVNGRAQTAVATQFPQGQCVTAAGAAGDLCIIDLDKKATVVA